MKRPSADSNEGIHLQAKPSDLELKTERKKERQSKKKVKQKEEMAITPVAV